MSEEALQITEKRREAKGKRKKERYTYLIIEFQRISRRDKQAFLSEQCKEENNRMGKTSDIFKKIRDAKMGTIKNRNFKDLTEAEEIRKQWLEYTELFFFFFKGLNNPDNNSSVITHLEPDILECEVKWALGSVTMNNS